MAMLFRRIIGGTECAIQIEGVASRVESASCSLRKKSSGFMEQ
jgi:hypothetical protein